MRAGCSGGGGDGGEGGGGYGFQRVCVSVCGGGKETRKGKKECVYQTRGSSATCTHKHIHAQIYTHTRVYIYARAIGKRRETGWGAVNNQ